MQATRQIKAYQLHSVGFAHFSNAHRLALARRQALVYMPAGTECTGQETFLPKLRMIPSYTTRLGRAFTGDALDVLRTLPGDSVSLVMTSPPFALRRKKAYGNVEPGEYVEWFW